MMTTAGNKPKPFGGRDGGHPLYEANLAKAQSAPLGSKRYGAGQTECCSYCGRYCRSRKWFGYHKWGDAYDVASDPETTVDACHVGFYPVGADCARKLKSAGCPVYTAEEMMGGAK